MIATKLENSIADMKRDGYTVAKAMLKLITFSDVSNMHWNTLLRQQTFLKVGIISNRNTVNIGYSDNPTQQQVFFLPKRTFFY